MMKSSVYRLVSWFYLITLFAGAAGQDDRCGMKESLFGPIAVVTETGDLNLASKRVFNMADDSSRDGYVSTGSGPCDRWNVSIVNAAVDRDSQLAIYDKQVLNRINDAQLILGPENRGIQSYISQSNCSDCSGMYFIKDAVGSHMEQVLEDRFLRGGGEISTTYSLWPSPTSHINCVVGNVKLYTRSKHNVGARKRVVLLTYTESEDSVLFVGRLRERLEAERMLVFVKDLHPLVELRMRGNLTGQQVLWLVSPVERMVVESRAALVILYMDTPVQTRIETVVALFSGRSRPMDHEGGRWLLANMMDTSLQYAGIKYAFRKLALHYTEILTLVPCLLFPETSSEVTARDVERRLGPCNRLIKYNEEDAETRKMEAASTLFKSLLSSRRRNNSDADALAFLKETMQTECPRETNVTQSMLASAGLLRCKDSDSARRVGFPRFDYIRTMVLNGGEPDAGMYMPKEPFDLLYQRALENIDRHPDTRQTLDWSDAIQVQDYVMFGARPRERLDYAAVVVEEPFVIRSRNGTEFTGMCIDIYNAVVLKLLRRKIALNLRYREVARYGSRREDGSWSGVFGQLRKPYEGDGSRTVLGLGQISITGERLADPFFTFSTDFGLTKLTHMTRKVTIHKKYSQFLRPFTTRVWLMLGFVFVLSGIYFRVIQGWNPFREELPEGSNFNSKESFWHSYLIVTQIGAPFGAVHLPSRVYSVVYWFFALVVVGCYTGNLAGFLTESTSFVPSITELVNERGFKFGMLSNSSVSSAYMKHVLQDTSSRRLKLDHDKLEMVNNYDQGVRKVKEEDFILVGTSLVMKHYQLSDEDCDLSVSDSQNFYDTRMQSLAFPMRSDWKLANDFKWSMNSLKETGELQLIYRKWITSNKKCAQDDNEDDSIRLGWDNFIGLYVLTAFGIVISYIFLALKLSHLKLKERREPERSTEDSSEEMGLTEQVPEKT